MPLCKPVCQSELRKDYQGRYTVRMKNTLHVTGNAPLRKASLLLGTGSIFHQLTENLIEMDIASAVR